VGFVKNATSELVGTQSFPLLYLALHTVWFDLDHNWRWYCMVYGCVQVNTRFQ